MLLVTELHEAGLRDAAMDRHGYVTATLASNLPPDHPAYERVPTVGLLAHVDTYPDVTGTDVKPQIHRAYDGGDIILPGDPDVVLRVADEPTLAACRGLTLVTTDGTTLLGADDKAGVAEILEVLWRLRETPERLHGAIRVGFTPDEEIGRGTEHFDVARFGAEVAYTLDGSGLGEIEDETFCADSAQVTVTGADVHPGYAKGRMVNATQVLAALLQALPRDRTPEATEGRVGFLHPLHVSGNVSQSTAHLLVRDFTEDGLRDLESVLRDTAGRVTERHPGARIDVTITPSYRNMRDAIARRPEVVSYAEDAIRRAGLSPKRGAIRGGTDGARLSLMGLPTPNLFDGSMNFHSPKEWVCLEWMDAAVETVLHLLDIWVERSCAEPPATRVPLS